ncbi:hypothetical protein BGX28_009286, partial [Mortierella sp. GBA30]
VYFILRGRRRYAENYEDAQSEDDGAYTRVPMYGQIRGDSIEMPRSERSSASFASRTFRKEAISTATLTPTSQSSISGPQLYPAMPDKGRSPHGDTRQALVAGGYGEPVVEIRGPQVSINRD